MAEETVKGIFYSSGVGGSGTGVRFMSNTTGYVIDLLSEGDVDGLVSGEYKPEPANTTGTIGYQQGVRFEPFNSAGDTGVLASIYWNKTPVFDKDSSKFNFTNINLDTNRTTISADGLSSRRLVVVNEKLRGLEKHTGSTLEHTKYYKYYTIRNQYCAKAIVNLKVVALGKIDRQLESQNSPNETYGKLLDSDVTVLIDYRPKYSSGSNIAWSTGKKVVIEGSLTGPYARSVDLDLPLSSSRDEEGLGDFIGWEIRVLKNKVEPTTPDVKNEIYVDNIIEEIDNKFLYPKSYVVKNEFDAESFSQIPERAYDMRLLKVKIPSNYDPATRTYHGNWDGTFSTESTGPYGKDGATRAKGLHWTDNPAWCFYDLITNKRYGLGKYVDTSNLDKWSLYEIAQYCDELVKDDKNEVEPRFTCNIIIQNKSDAYQVLNDMASIFRGIVYYNAGSLYAVQDSLKDSIYQFNNSNVEEGSFKYSSTSAKVRHTVAIIRYNDKNNKFEPAVEYVEDVEGIRKYGIKEKEISAFGCTSKSQAQRLGRWVLSTESNETETVSFTAGQEGGILRPGDVFTVSDSNRLMTRRGGRIKAYEKIDSNHFKIAIDSTLKGGKYWDGTQGKFLTKDAPDNNREYLLTLSTPSFYYDTSQVNIGNSSESSLIRNKHIQTFKINRGTIDISNPSGVSVLTVSGALDTTNFSISGFSGESLWSLSTTEVDNSADTFFETLDQEQKYRIVNISERDEGKYEIAGAEYAEPKYKEIDQAVTPTNQVSFDIPSSPNSINNLSSRSLSAEGAPNTKVIEFDIGKSPSSSVSYYQAYIKKSSSFPTESDYDSTVKVYSTNAPSASFIPASDGTYKITVYAYNSLGQSNGSYGSAKGTITVGGINPIRDIKISHLSLSDDAAGGAVSNSSDPSTLGNVDQYDGSTVAFKWKTSVPQYQGANIAIDFSYQVKIFADKYSTSDADLTHTSNNYSPNDSELSLTNFSWSLIDNFASVGGSDYDKIYRKYTLKVVAQNPDLSTSNGSSDGRDFLYVNNPEPAKPTNLQGFIDLNNHLKIFNLDRPASAKYVYVLSAPTTFTYAEYASGARTDIEIKKISADVDVIEIDPNYKTDDLQNAYYMLAYIDQFDLDIESLVKTNGDESTWKLDKKLSSRISDVVHIEKVTPEVIDLMGEGWKAWIKIDIDGKWYGRGVKCVQDVTNQYTDYAGYLPFYCTLKSPTIFMNPALNDVKVGYSFGGAAGEWSRNNFQMGCGYYIKPGSESSYPPNVSTKDISPIGGYTSQMYNSKYPLGFKRYRIYFEKSKNPNKYWVMGMNARNENYYDDAFLNGVKAFFDPTSTISPSYADEFRAGAQDAYDAAKLAGSPYQNKQLQIGGSDAYFNFHPAGFVQGFGGLPKTVDYFDIHMGHMVDKTYLDQGIFFVMATDQAQKNLDPNPPCS